MPGDPGERAPPSRRSRWGWMLAGAAAAGALFGWLIAGPQAREGDTLAVPAADRARPAPVAPPPAPAPVAAAASAGPYSAAGAQARAAQLALWQLRLERSQHVLDQYRAGTRYPQGSRPAAEQADQLRPNDPIVEEHPLREAGRDRAAAEGVRLRTSQQRVYVLGAESVRFTLALVDAQSRALPLRVLHANAREFTLSSVASLFPVVPVAFGDDGSGGDVTAGDLTYSAVLQPSTMGFAGLAGQIRLEVALEARGERGFTTFDLHVTPEPPAEWSGSPRDGVLDGALTFVLPLQVREPGRYVVAGRVDDAQGRPVALLTFNDELPPGAAEVRLVLHGRLLHDAQPAFPLTLRDVDGFLLRERGHPDRLLLARREGPVHASARHALAAFSAAEYAGEERQRYLAELTKDVDEAQRQVERLRP
jgi:hypothetical protein